MGELLSLLNYWPTVGTSVLTCHIQDSMLLQKNGIFKLTYHPELKSKWNISEYDKVHQGITPMFEYYITKRIITPRAIWVVFKWPWINIWWREDKGG